MFAHEFFHLMQLNTLLFTGRPGSRWLNVFIEAQAKFAPSVQYPEIELVKSKTFLEDREFVSASNHFLMHSMNSSYRDLERNRTNKCAGALYWRFLYKQSGDMGIIRVALEEMATGYQPDIAGAMESVMNRVFACLDGPFETFEESLVAFARASYGLRLENGRRAAANPAECQGRFYDPEGMYVDPALEAQLDYDGVRLAHHSFIPTRSGMDFADFGVADELSVSADGVGPTSQGSIPASYGRT